MKKILIYLSVFFFLVSFFVIKNEVLAASKVSVCLCQPNGQGDPTGAYCVENLNDNEICKSRCNSFGIENVQIINNTPGCLAGGFSLLPENFLCLVNGRCVPQPLDKPCPSDISFLNQQDCEAQAQPAGNPVPPAVGDPSHPSGGCLCRMDIDGPLCEISNFSIVVPYGHFSVGDIFDYITTDERLMGQINEDCNLASLLADRVINDAIRGIGLITQEETCQLNQAGGEVYGHNYSFSCQNTDQNPVFAGSPVPEYGDSQDNLSGQSQADASQSDAQKKEKAYVQLINPIGGNSNVPQGQPRIMDVSAKLLKGVIGILGSGALLVFVYGGLMWLISGGEEDKIKKGTDAMKWAVIGIFIIFSSYAILNLLINNLRQ